MAKNLDKHKPKSIYPLSNQEQRKRLVERQPAGQPDCFEMFIPLSFLHKRCLYYEDDLLTDFQIKDKFQRYGIDIVSWRRVYNPATIKTITFFKSRIRKILVGYDVRFYNQSDMMAIKLIL